MDMPDFSNIFKKILFAVAVIAFFIGLVIAWAWYKSTGNDL